MYDTPLTFDKIPTRLAEQPKAIAIHIGYAQWLGNHERSCVRHVAHTSGG